jgi:hypothetical protein
MSVFNFGAQVKRDMNVPIYITRDAHNNRIMSMMETVDKQAITRITNQINKLDAKFELGMIKNEDEYKIKRHIKVKALNEKKAIAMFNAEKKLNEYNKKQNIIVKD